MDLKQKKKICNPQRKQRRVKDGTKILEDRC